MIPFKEISHQFFDLIILTILILKNIMSPER